MAVRPLPSSLSFSCSLWSRSLSSAPCSLALSLSLLRISRRPPSTHLSPLSTLTGLVSRPITPAGTLLYPFEYLLCAVSLSHLTLPGTTTTTAQVAAPPKPPATASPRLASPLPLFLFLSSPKTHPSPRSRLERLPSAFSFLVSPVLFAFGFASPYSSSRQPGFFFFFFYRSTLAYFFITTPVPATPFLSIGPQPATSRLDSNRPDPPPEIATFPTAPAAPTILLSSSTSPDHLVRLRPIPPSRRRFVPVTWSPGVFPCSRLPPPKRPPRGI